MALDGLLRTTSSYVSLGSKIYFSMRIGAVRISHMKNCGMCIGEVSKTKILLLISDETSYSFYLAFRPGEVKLYPEAVILYQIILKQLSVTSTAPSLLLIYTNPSHDQDARQWARALFLFLLFGPSVFDNHCTTQ